MWAFRFVCLQVILDDSMDDIVRLLTTNGTQVQHTDALPMPDARILSQSSATGTALADVSISASMLSTVSKEDINLSGIGMMDVSPQPPSDCALMVPNNTFANGACNMARVAAVCGNMRGSPSCSSASPVVTNPVSFHPLFTSAIINNATPTIQMEYPQLQYTTKTRVVRTPSPPPVCSRGKYLAAMNRVQALTDPEYMKVIQICLDLHFEQQLDLSNRLRNAYAAKMRELKNYSTQ